MSEMHNETLFAKWLDGTLTADERQLFEQRCIQDEAFSQRVETANRVVFEAQQYPAAEVPHWDKSATIGFSRGANKTPWQWLPVMSMAMSFAALFLVVTGFQLRMDDGNVHMGFNLTPTHAQLAELVEEKISDYQSTNQTLMAQYIDALQTQNAQSRTELTRFLLETSREERREDFAELIKFINEQRDDDQRFYARQLNQLETDLLSSSLQE